MCGGARFNLSWNNTSHAGGAAQGSGDQLFQNQPQKLLHEFKFVNTNPDGTMHPNSVRAGDTGAFTVSGYRNTQLRHWEKNRPVLLLAIFPEDELDMSSDKCMLYYCPAPMNERIKGSISYSVLNFQVIERHNKRHLRFYLNTAQEGYVDPAID
ncbi:unnamed protein product, partial [Amoebophrya sp. A25]|eukprot:GSA25T00020154001.1